MKISWNWQSRQIPKFVYFQCFDEFFHQFHFFLSNRKCVYFQRFDEFFPSLSIFLFKWLFSFWHRNVGDNSDEATITLHAKYGGQETTADWQWNSSSQTQAIFSHQCCEQKFWWPCQNVDHGARSLSLANPSLDCALYSHDFLDRCDVLHLGCFAFPLG